MKRLPLFAIPWLIYGVLTLPLLVFGVVLIAVLAHWPYAIRARQSRHYTDGRLVAAWRWSWFNAIYGNDEDGIDGLPLTNMTAGVMPRQAWWLDKTKGWSRWRRIFVWSALRNSTSNLRFAPFFGLKINPTRVRFIVVNGADGLYDWFLCWQGYKAGFRYFWNPKRCFWIGWKVLPQDIGSALELPASDTRAPGAGFAFQPWGSV